jgi:Zn-dependent protease/predicted transcriptional regulator
VKWSWKLGTFAGIPVYVHSTFALLIVFIVARDLGAGASVAAAVGSALFLLAIFATIVLHEYGHALTARRYGIKTRDITLLPIGGLARLERLPEVPRQELYVALAGPAVNLLIAALTFVGAALLGVGLGSPTADLSGGNVLGRFVAVNVLLAVFNLIPAFPMDGGRALRAWLAERYDYSHATEIAANLGQALAFAFGLLGLLSGNPMLLFIALFVWVGATAEASSASVRSVIAGIPVERAMITDFHVVEAGDSLQRAADLVIAGQQQDFPVLEAGRLVGVLTRDRLIRAIAERGLESPVREAMTATYETAEARELLGPAFERLQTCPCPVLPVLSDGRVVGLLTTENVGEFVMLRTAIARRR